ncbi:MAG: nucleoside 2-deoxyribosyltransferase [Nanoarchaeota archaeon]|nr:nucleoside 2-deoxyribosyltransferase [Nanoarchaeota archaeon]
MAKLVYLAGPIDGCTYGECTSWRDYAIRELSQDGITGLSPMRAKDFLKEHPKLVDGISEHVLISDAGITTRDMWDVRRSDAILFNLLGAEKVSTGTMIEYGWGSAFNKPLITAMESEGNVHEHNMIRRLSGYRVETLEEGLLVVRALFDY